MRKYLPYIAKSLWRNRTRTALTVSGAAVAMFVFTFVTSMQDGLAGLGKSGDADRTLIVFQANRFCPSTSRMPEHYAPTIAKITGVKDVYPIQVFMNNCRVSLDLVVFNGLPPEKLRQARNFRLIAGDWGAFEKQRDAALVGHALATRRGLSVGKRFSVGEATVLVAGIYEAASPAEESYLYTHLQFLQRTRGLNAVGSVTQFEVVLTEGTDPNQMCRTIDTLFRGGPIQTDTRPRDVFQRRAVGDLAELIGFTRYLGFACVGLVIALVATTTLMAVQDRVREHAVLQTLGFSWRRVFALVMTESFIVSMIGGLVGVMTAIGVISWQGFAIGTEGVNIPFTASPLLAATGLAATTAVGLLAGLVPAWQAARGEIVASLRYV